MILLNEELTQKCFVIYLLMKSLLYSWLMQRGK